MLDQPYDLVRLLSRRLPPAAGIERIRLRRLRALCDYAFRNVPYYRRLFESAGLRPADIREVADLRLLPYSRREDLRDAGTGRISQAVDPESCRRLYSSGSTGQPWPVWRTPLEDRLRRAVELRSMAAAGIGPGDRIVTLGPVVENARPTLGRFGLYRTRFVSPKLPVEQQAKQLQDLQPTVFWVYPTALRALLNEVGALEGIIRPRMVVTSAEPLDEPLRQRLLAGAPLQLRNFYGTVELGRVAWSCGAGEGLHINTDCCIVELDESETVPGAGRPVIVTNLNSWASPYIRFRVGDRVELVAGPCSCGSPLPLMKPPTGREWDVISLPGGRQMAPWAFNSIFRSLPGLLQFRVTQKSLDRLLVQLQFSAAPGAHDLRTLRGRLENQLGEPMTVELETVDRFVDDRLKFRAFVSELPRTETP